MTKKMDQTLKQQLRKIAKELDWGVMASFQAFIVEKWNEKGLKGENEYETVCNVIERDSKIGGLKEFLETLEKIGYDN